MAHDWVDVLVVGAGPVGLFCANELARHGLSCRIIEKKSALSDKSKALGLHIRTLDVFNDCGFLEDVLAAGHQVQGVLFKSGSKELVNATFAEIDANFHFLIDLPQDRTERILHEKLVGRGIGVEWQKAFTFFKQENAGVTAHITCEDGETEIIKSRWLIACDGAHSTVRHLCGLDFVGAEYKQSWWLADLLIDWDLPEDRMVIYLSSFGPMACFPMGHKRYRLVLTAPQQANDDPNFEDIQTEFKQRSSDAAELSEPIWLTKFNIHHRQIQQYQQGRIFLAGDAAHIHSPMGGQGLNTGIQDVYNLVWKLALVEKRLAHESLLGSYHSERYPVGKKVLTETDVMTRFALLKNPLAINMRNVFVSWLMSFGLIRNKLANQIAELEISYADSPVTINLAHSIKLKAGCFFPDFFLQSLQCRQPVALTDIIRGTMHHLFLFCGLNSENKEELLETAEWVQKNYSAIVKVHIVVCEAVNSTDYPCTVWLDEKGNFQRLQEMHESTAVLFRPDKYIGFTQMPFHQGDLSEYFAELFYNQF